MQLPLERERVHRPADVLRARELHHAGEAELDVDVHDGAVRDEPEPRVDVALAGEGVHRLRRPVAVRALRLEHAALGQALDLGGDRAQRLAHRAADEPRQPRR